MRNVALLGLSSKMKWSCGEILSIVATSRTLYRITSQVTSDHSGKAQCSCQVDKLFPVTSKGVVRLDCLPTSYILTHHTVDVLKSVSTGVP
jgi:hypothetical protein